MAKDTKGMPLNAVRSIKDLAGPTASLEPPRSVEAAHMKAKRATNPITRTVHAKPILLREE